jgi:hypothetical protein
MSKFIKVVRLGAARHVSEIFVYHDNAIYLRRFVSATWSIYGGEFGGLNAQ